MICVLGWGASCICAVCLGEAGSTGNVDCVIQYRQPCPYKWTLMSGGVCAAPPDYRVRGACLLSRVLLLISLKRASAGDMRILLVLCTLQ